MKYLISSVFVLAIFLGCENRSTHNDGTAVSASTVEGVYQNAIKEALFKSKHPPQSYQELAWQKMKSSENVSKRIGKRVLFIRHRFQEKNNYKGAIQREYIYFIGDTKPSLMIDFDVKKAFGEFIDNQSVQEIFSSSIWNLSSLHVNYQQSFQDASSKQLVKDFIYSIRRYSKEDQSYLEEAISKAYTPLSIANNVALFMTMRLFPELLEELLFDEVIYEGTYK
ncbi:hypothetical protein [Sulfurospirillum barnesii]|uniref:Lipoprotein n=1 Tax=Sulfurospirillum barnesii (strain ATCC 700032 / DSM 10660 / SES-3) TaxID=760154 RepID=I3XTS7_SULBS|nr:hypothetical protein [Sulfurospirillum barnesii]AFL67351.1 hypothetical protein Sulba_0017 [Sulfurospirillum barnesii SES-3]